MSLDLLAPEIDKLPENWRIKKLGQIAKTYAGGTPLRSNPLYYNGNIPWVKSGEVDNPNIYETEESVTELAIKETATRFIEKNSVLIALYGATAGKVGRLRVRACSNQAVLAVNTIDENADNDFIYYYLKLSAEALIKMSQGSGQPNLSKGIIDKLLIKFPPLPEQQKIAKILSTVDAKIEAIDQRIAETQALKKGLMQQLLTKGIGHTKFNDSPLGEIPESWEVKELDKIGIQLIDGDRGSNYPKSKDFIENEGYCLFLSAKNVTKNGFQFNELQFINEERDKLLRKGKLSRNDFVITTRGSVGHIAFYNDSVSFENIRLNSGMVILRDNQGIFENHFLYQIMRSPIFEAQISIITSGSAQPQLTIKTLKRLKLPIPNLAEQQKIAEILSSVDEKIQIQQDKKAEYQELKKGLMQQLLTGKIRVSLPQT